KDMAIVVIYVDDLIIATKNNFLLRKIQKGLAEEFDMKDLGPIYSCLGMEITQDRRKGEIVVTQKRLIADALKKFGMTDCKAAKTPMEAGLKLCKPAEGAVKEGEYLYQQLIGTLLYLAVTTRHDTSLTLRLF